MNKIAYFKLGYNFDFELPYTIRELNEKYKNNDRKIIEVYGSIKQDARFAARPDFRLPNISRDNFKKHVRLLRKIGIEFNYTLNAPYLGNKDIITSNEFLYHLERVLKMCRDSGVRRITIATPLLLEIIKKYFKDFYKSFFFEISTIFEIQTVTQLIDLKEKYEQIDKICVNLSKNRDIKFLKNLVKAGNIYKVMIELMANEFCGTGGKDYATHCIYRNSCYLLHSVTKAKKEAMRLDNYPMQFCMNCRNNNPATWLKLRWIRPEDIQKYVNIGVINFKLTGRTGTTEYIEKIASAYLSGKFNGNLLGLWKPLETIYNGKKESEQEVAYNIPNEELDGFIDFWFEHEEHDCAKEICGITCNYCNEYFEKII